jgi:hypothetical protein
VPRVSHEVHTISQTLSGITTHLVQPDKPRVASAPGAGELLVQLGIREIVDLRSRPHPGNELPHEHPVSAI